MAAVATALTGCAGSNNATSSQASAQGEQPYKTMYGLSSEGTTTDLYTELFGPRQPPPAPAVASAQPVQQPIAGQPVAGQPVTAQPVYAQPAAPVQKPATRQAQTKQSTRQIAATDRAAPPPPVQPAPVQVTQQPPPEQPYKTMYGLSSDGPTTDLYTMIFGPRDGK